MKETREALWQRLIGNPSDFSLESRIFHSICVVGLVVLAYHVPFNFYIGLPEVAVISFIMLILLGWTYYLSRVQHKLGLSITMFCILSNLMIAAVYYYNSGLEGTAVLLFSMLAYLYIAIVPRRQYIIWIPLNILVVLGLLTLEYLYPSLIINTYENAWSRYVDFTSAYVVVVVIMYFSVNYIRNNYDAERESARNRAVAIEEQHKQILLQNSELELLNVEKNKLFSIIAHDLRTPLGSIQSYLELLSQSVEGQEKKNIEQDLLEITRNTSGLLSNLLSWAKAQMDGVAVKIETVNLLDALQSSLEFEKSIAFSKDISLTYNIDPDIFIQADVDMLQLVIRNLVTNAVKFTNFGEEILVEAKSGGSDCIITVRDFGMGIPYDQQDKVFSLKAQSTFGTRNEKGVGLGLVLCKEFTELQGGKIWFDSIPGVSTTFYVSMPCAHSPVETVENSINVNNSSID